MEGERPHFGKVNPLWEHSLPFHDYITRTACLSTASKPDVDTALFFDGRSLWTGGRFSEYAIKRHIEISDRLAERQCDFDYVDDDALASVTFSNNRLVIGEASYGQLVLPMFSLMAPEAEKRVDELKAAGLRVLNQDEVDKIVPTLIVAPATWKLRVRKHQLPGEGALYFVFNTTSTKVKARLVAPDPPAPVALCDAEDGGIYSIAAKDNAWNWEFPEYGMAVFMVGSGAAGAAPRPRQCGQPFETLNGPWSLKPTRQYSVGEHNYVIGKPEISENASALPVKLGDWRAVLGDNFSGDAIYATSFDLQAADKPLLLDLGDVRFAARVSLNGVEIATRIWKPFVFDLTGKAKPGKNTLEIMITNTLANAIAAKGVLEKWRNTFAYEIPYEEISRIYEADSLPSGLFGPVTLCSSL